VKISSFFRAHNQLDSRSEISSGFFSTSDLLFDTDHFAAAVDQLLQLLRKTLHSSTRNTLAAGVSA
jgi:hypothetical protein